MSRTTTCAACGKSVPDESYCSRCGTSLDEETQAEVLRDHSRESQRNRLKHAVEDLVTFTESYGDEDALYRVKERVDRADPEEFDRFID